MKNKTKTQGESGSSPSGKYNDGPGNSRSGLRGVVRVGEWGGFPLYKGISCISDPVIF